MDFNYQVDPVWQKKPVLGFDLGSRYLKVVELRKQGKLTKLAGYGKLIIPDNYIVEGIVSEPEKLADLIKDFLANHVTGKIVAKRVNASLPESKIFTRLLTLPRMKEKAIADAINWEASQSIPMPLTDLYLDWQVIGPSKANPKDLEVIIAAAPKSIVNSYIQLFGLLGLEPYSIETSLNAIIRAMIPVKDLDESVLVIDFGARTINMAIFDHVIRVTGSTMLSGDDILKRITSKVTVNSGAQLDVKSRKYSEENIKAAVAEEISEVIREADRIIKYYNEKNNNKEAVSKIFLTGGNAVIPHLAEVFREKLELSTEIGNPWENVSVSPLKSVSKKDAPSYANAIGLALLGIEENG